MWQPDGCMLYKQTQENLKINVSAYATLGLKKTLIYHRIHVFQQCQISVKNRGQYGSNKLIVCLALTIQVKVPLTG